MPYAPSTMPERMSLEAIHPRNGKWFPGSESADGGVNGIELDAVLARTRMAHFHEHLSGQTSRTSATLPISRVVARACRL